MEKYNFDNIRSYRDNDVNEVLKRLFNDESFIEILKLTHFKNRIDILKEEIKSVNSIYDFQGNYLYHFTESIINETTSNFSYSGLDKLNKKKPYLFISNHRDIILDSALLNNILFKNKYTTSEIGIGNNLLIYQWINDIVRLNKSFIVRRDLKGRDRIKASFKLSAYIRDTIINRKVPVWIAQRQGRTKDGNDKTNSGILKMFNLSGESDFETNFKELNIIPLTISYEYEPCVKAKVNEIYISRHKGEYIKTAEDDLKGMGKGIYEQKGKVHFGFGKPINDKITLLQDIKNKNEKIEVLIKIIDKEIYKAYNLTEFNYIAYDLQKNTTKYKNKYTYQKLTEFKSYLKEQISGIEGNKEVVSQIFNEIYSNPVINFELSQNI